mgnify:CR=1 FL=1
MSNRKNEGLETFITKNEFIQRAKQKLMLLKKTSPNINPLLYYLVIVNRMKNLLSSILSANSKKEIDKS